MKERLLPKEPDLMNNDDVHSNSEGRMTKAIDALKTNMCKIRTGRANASLLDHIMVPYYGTDTPLNQVASMSVLDARTLTVAPWDKSIVGAIEKAIHTSDLGLNPVVHEDVIRVPIPQLSEDRRRDLVKVIKDEAEQTRIGIRQIRRDANQSIKQSVKDKKMSEDDSKRKESDIQELTDQYVHQIDDLVKQKEQEIMSI